jgi:hypothetical protein
MSVTIQTGNRVTISAPGPQGPPGSGGGGTPGGLNTQVQFNDAGSFGGDAGLTYAKSTDTLTGVNQTFTGLSTLGHIHGNIAGSLYVHIKNTSGVTIAKGTPVYATGSVGSSGEVEVAAADYTNSAKMPSIGITDTQLIANAEGNAVVVGEVMGLATNGYSINQELFVGTAGLLGALPTTGEAQSIAVVSRVHESTGIIVINAQARLNAALRALANNDGSNLTGITAAQVGALAPDGDGSALTGITADQVGALAPSGDGSALTGITAAQVGALEPTGDGSALTGITATQVGAIADGDTVTALTIETLTTPQINLLDTESDHYAFISLRDDLTQNRSLGIQINDGNRVINLSGDLTVSAAATISGTNSGNVTLAGTPDYITISGQTITRNAIDLASDITGTLPIANGGTGQTTAVAAFDALAPTTTKGDLIVHNGSDNVRVPVGGTNGHVLTVDSAEATGVKWAAGGGGGLTNITETLHTASPNNTVNAEQLAVTGGTTNVDLVLTPKGTGAFIFGPRPDSTATGGNKRGTSALDLQLSRTSADQIAVGNDSVAIGNRNRSSGVRSVTIGSANQTGATGAMAFGQNSSATGGNSLATGEGIASGEGAWAHNYLSLASGVSSLAFGFYAVAPIRGQRSYCSGIFSANGDAQDGAWIARNSTTNTTPKELFLNGSSERLTIPSNKARGGKMYVTAKQASSSNVCYYEVDFAAVNHAGTSSLLFATTAAHYESSAGADFVVTVSDATDAVIMTWTAPDSNTWRVVAAIYCSEVQ